jgi:7-cyano-7-deazaguanine synthase in queuosine biosynthesis/intein/homing endonuclease
MQNVVMGLSGGMDSATVLGYYYNKEYQIYPLFFNYGSKHNKYEFESAKKLAEYFETKPLKIVELDFISKIFKSNLLENQGEIPEGHYNDSNMSLTVVPGRNSIFITIMAGYAESVGADTVAVGTHMGDHCIPASEFIMTDHGKIPMEWLEVGDKVLSQNLETGKLSFEKVIKKVNNGLRQDILEIENTSERNIKVTSNHKCFRINRSNFNHHTGWVKSVEEVEAQDLEIGDWLLTPGAHDRELLQFQETVQKIDLLDYCDLSNNLMKYDKDYIWFKQQNKVNRFVDSKAVIKLLAWFITEGYKGSGNTKNANTYRVGIPQSITKNKQHYDEIVSVIKEWGFNTTECSSSNGNTIYFSGPTTKIFDLCGTYSENKMIPHDFILTHPTLLFDTLMKGDGCITHDGYNFQYQYITKSPILKEQISWIATILGYSVGISINHQGIFSISMRKNFTKKINAFGESRMVQIKNIKEANNEVVYDIEVENNHNFFTGCGSGILVSNSIYPDCRPIFISAMNTAIQASTGEKVHIETPIQHLDKTGILKIGNSFTKPVPYELTRTCYKNQEFSCGKCGSCRERLEAFENIGRKDPIQYQK